MPPAPQASVPPIIPDYELLRPIGKGSYGEVWLARSVTGVFRVIKVVRRDRFEDERPYLRELEGISRFQAAASGRPRQLALLHVGRNDAAGYFYYVMEPADDVEAGSSIDPDRYVPLTLKELFSRRGRLPANECIQLALELARGLAILHGANLIHRDIKPSNIIFVQRVPKLADVGLVASSEATMTCAGTPGYAPREGAGTVAADIFSLGKVLYEIATGLDRMEFPRLPSDIVDGPDAPLLREINSIVLKACHHDPDARHTSAEALARDLEVVQAGRSVAFYEALRKRLRAIAFAAALIALLAGGGAGLLVWRSQILAAANEQTRQALYRSDLAVAQLARSSGDLGRARAALLRQIPKNDESDLRGLEWRILSHAVRGEGTPLEPASEGNAVIQIVTDPSGRWAAASFKDDSAAIWDLTTHRITRRLNNVRVLGGFTRDGTLIIDETNRALRYESPTQGTLRRWETGQRLGAIVAGESPAVVSKEGRFEVSILASPTSTESSTKPIIHEHEGFIPSDWTITKDAQRFVIALFREEGAQKERILAGIDISTGRQTWEIHHSSKLVWVRASPDGETFAVNVGGVNPTIFHFDSPTNTIQLQGHTARVHDGSFSQNGLLIATASADQTIRVWNTKSGNQVSTHRGLSSPATSIAWAANGEYLLAGDDRGNVVEFPFSATRKGATMRTGFFSDAHGDVIYDEADKNLLVTASTNRIDIVDISSLSTIDSISNYFQAIRCQSNKITLIKSDFSIHEIESESKRPIRSSPTIDNAFSPKFFSLSPSQRYFAVTGDSGKICLLDLDSFSSLNLQDPESNTVWTCTFSFDSKELWTGNMSGQIRRWEIETGQLLPTQITAEGDITSIALSPDDRWVAAALYEKSSVQIYDRVKDTWISHSLKHRRFVQSLLFTKKGDRLISGGADGRIVYWSTPDFDEIAAFEVESTPEVWGDEGVATLKISPKEDGMAALTEDGRLAVWHTR